MTGVSDSQAFKAAFMELGAATLGESGAKVMDPRMVPVWPGAAVAGPAYTVRCSPGDNLALHAAVSRAPAGSVLVVAVGLTLVRKPDNTAARGYWGEVLTTAAEARGVAGLVIDGGVRDRDALEKHQFPVFATTIALRGATKIQRGTNAFPVEVGGVTVHTHDWVVGDADGVVVIAADHLAAVLEAGRERAKKEEGYFEALKSGWTTVQLLELDISPIAEG